jgi:hypothetical protein
MRLVFLDTGPLGMVSNPRGKPPALRCRQWVKDLSAAGVRVLVPEIADYEVRRELLRVGATTGLARLDLVKATLDYVPITTAVMHRAGRALGRHAAGRAPDGGSRCPRRGLHPGRPGSCWRPIPATWWPWPRTTWGTWVGS